MTKTATWTVLPNEGLLPVRFGDTAERVSQIAELSQVTRRLDGRSGEVTEMRALSDPAISYKDDRVFYIAVGRRVADVVFQSLDVFAASSSDVLAAFETAQGAPAFEQLGRVVFETLNISLEGFYNLADDSLFKPDGTEQDNRTLILHAPGTLQVFDTLPKTSVSFLG